MDARTDDKQAEPVKSVRFPRKGETIELLGIKYRVLFASKSTGELRLKEVRGEMRPVDPFPQNNNGERARGADASLKNY